MVILRAKNKNMFVSGELRVKAPKCLQKDETLRFRCWRKVPNPMEAGALWHMMAAKISRPSYVSPN